MTSSGIGSYMAGLRVAEKHGTDDLLLLFTDVKGTSASPHAGEDEDNYRFLRESTADTGGELVWLNAGEDIWQVFDRRKRIGSGYAANCSYELKQKPARKWLDDNCDPADTTIYVGIDWTETHRQAAVEKHYAPYPARFPLMDPPLIDKDGMRELAAARGIDPPRLYRAGFAHANCGGFCVKAGEASMALLLRENPDRFRYHEEREQEWRDKHGKDVAVLNEKKFGQTVPLTLRRFRERLDDQPGMFDPLDVGGCGCFVDGPS